MTYICTLFLHTNASKLLISLLIIYICALLPCNQYTVVIKVKRKKVIIRHLLLRKQIKNNLSSNLNIL